MEQSITSKDLQDFALNFDENITRPLERAGYDKYNVFTVLNISRQELRHSDFLAFLFDINRSGNLGRQFLKNFLVSLIEKNKASNLNRDDVLDGKIDGVNVYREVPTKDGRIDILIELEIKKDKRQKVVIAIENKTDSDLHDNQLEKYKKYLVARYEDYIKIMLYLTPNEAKSGYSEWKEIDYMLISEVLDNIDTNIIDSTLKILIEDYKKLIGSEFDMKNGKETALTKQALEIYVKHRNILDFIFDAKPDWRKETSEILCKLLEVSGAKIVKENKYGVLVENNKKDLANIMFTVKEIENNKNFFFQIGVEEMCLYFIQKLQGGLYKQHLSEHLVDSNKLEDFKNKFIEKPSEYQAECQAIIERIFKAGTGAIEKEIATLKI